MIDLNKTAHECLKISNKREENGGVGHDVLKHCAGEVCEAIEAKKTLEELEDYNDFYTLTQIQEAQGNYAYELADIVICALVAFAKEGIDPEGAITRKMKQNEARALGLGDKK